MHGLEMVISQVLGVAYGHIENITHASAAAHLQLAQGTNGISPVRFAVEVAQLFWTSDWSRDLSWQTIVQL